MCCSYRLILQWLRVIPFVVMGCNGVYSLYVLDFICFQLDYVIIVIPRPLDLIYVSASYVLVTMFPLSILSLLMMSLCE